MPSAGESAVPSSSVIGCVALWVSKQRCGSALQTGSAVSTHCSPVEDDEVAGRNLGHAVAHRLDDPSSLVSEEERKLVADPAPPDKWRSVWHTPHAWTSTTASPGPGSGITILSIETGAPSARATTPFTVCGISAPPFAARLVVAHVKGGSPAAARRSPCVLASAAWNSPRPTCRSKPWSNRSAPRWPNAGRLWSKPNRAPARPPCCRSGWSTSAGCAVDRS